MPTVHFSFFYNPPTRERLTELCLSVVLASRHYDVVVHTNERELLLDLELPGKLVHRAFQNFRPWSRHKLETYLAATAVDGDEFFIHLDSDVFLTAPLPDRLMRAKLFAQSIDHPSRYAGLAAMPRAWLNRFRPKPLQAYNCGVIGGHSEFIRQYAQFSLEACDSNSGGKATFYEQATLGRFAQDHGLNCEVLMNEANPMPGYTHLMTAKDNPLVIDRVRERLRKEAPAMEAAVSRMVRSTPVITTHPRITADTIRKFYAQKKPWRLEPPPHFEVEHAMLSNVPLGLGDTLIITDLPRSAANLRRTAQIWSPSPHFLPLMQFNPWYRNKSHPVRISLCDAIARWNLGPGHTIQRAQRLFNLPVQPVPTPCVEINVNKPRSVVHGRVSLHFEAGKVDWQRKHIHPRARMVYPETMAAIARFVREHSEMTFMEVGSKAHLAPLLPDKIQDATGISIDETVRLMSECEYHLGINSGPMHVAAALGAKVIVIINFPHPGMLMLPNLVNTGVCDTEWIYPQSVVLHQDTDSAHWPLFNYNSLSRAFDGDVFPYWDNAVLNELAGITQEEELNSEDI